MAKIKKIISKDETKRERFIRVATPRVEKALKSIQLVGTCFNSPQYESNGSDWEAFEDAVTEFMVAAAPKVSATSKKSFTGFA